MQNEITKIENLEPLSCLRFLTLAGNRISRIEGLQGLKKLGFLDLSDNLIEQLDLDGLPQSLLLLSLRRNPCAERKEYRASVAAALPHLRELDGQMIAGETDSNEDSGGSEGEEQEEDVYYHDKLWSLDGIKGLFGELRTEWRGRTEQRASRAAVEQPERLHEALNLWGWAAMGRDPAPPLHTAVPQGAGAKPSARTVSQEQGSVGGGRGRGQAPAGHQPPPSARRGGRKVPAAPQIRLRSSSSLVKSSGPPSALGPRTPPSNTAAAQTNRSPVVARAAGSGRTRTSPSAGTVDTQGLRGGTGAVRGHSLRGRAGQPRK
ncbi:leucine-rich repeat-containing protein 46-like [Amia ocellicauda]|uniref:leucine-rich repeat-containing protein 46-like n=1 Tax=Amia ocellicauda TaxID=2972642 RepID=UPI003464408C